MTGSQDDLVVRYNSLKQKKQDFENKKIQLQTSIDIKTKEIQEVEAQLQALGITDFSNLDAEIQSRRQAFEQSLQELEGELSGVQSA